MAITAREVIYKIIGDATGLAAGFQDADKALDDFNEKTEAANRILGDIAKQSAIATTAIVAVGIAVGKMAADYNAALSQVETLIPGQTARIQELKAAIQDLSPEVRKTTDDLVSGAYQVISAYGDAPDTIEKLEISAKAAAAGAATTTDSINLLSAVTKAYGDTSAVAQRQVADLAFITVRNGQTTFPELATSIQRVTSLSATLGVSQAELFAVFSAGTGVIGGAAEVATKTAAAQAELLRGTDTLNAAFKALGVTSGTELIQKFGGFQGALQALKGYADETGVSVTNLFGSIEGGQIALYLTGQGAEKFTKDLGDMGTAAGALDTAFSASTDGVNKFGDGLTQARLNAVVFAQRLGDEVLVSAQDLLGPLVSISEALANLDRETLANIVSIGKVVVVALATTAAVAGFTKGLIAARAAMIALSGAAAANPLGAAIVGITVAVATVTEFAKAAERAKQAVIDNTDAVIGLKAQAAPLAQEYASLNAKTGKTATDMERMAELVGDLKRLYPELTAEILAQAAAQGTLNDLLEKTAEARAKEQLAALDKQQVELAKKHFETTQKIELLEERLAKARKSNDPRESQGIARTIEIDLGRARDKAGDLARQLIVVMEAREKLLDAGSGSPGGAPPPPRDGGAPAGDPDPAKSSNKTRAERLQDLDDEYAVRRSLAAKNGEDLYAIEKEAQGKRLALLHTFVQEDVAARKGGADVSKAMAASLDSSITGGYGKIAAELATTRARLKELSAESVGLELDASITFLSASGLTVEQALRNIQEAAKSAADAELNNAKGLSAEQTALNLRLADTNLSETSAVAIRSRLSAITEGLAKSDARRAEAMAVQEESSRRLLAVDLERIGGTAEKTEAAIDREIALKKETGLLGKTDKEIERNALQEKRNALIEKQRSLMGEYNTLMASGSAADAQRAAALRGEILELGAATVDVKKQIEKSTSSLFDKIAAKIDVIGGKITEVFSSVANIATGLIGNQAERDAQEYAERLAEIEQEKNAALSALDDQLNEMREAHREENEAAQEAYEERQYQTQQEEYARTIADLETSISEETNIRRLRELEKQLEDERKKKREAQEAKKKDQEDKKRAAEQLKAENDLLNERNRIEYEFTVSQIETENAAGTAAAAAAIEKAKWEKASTVLNLTLQAAENVAKAAANWWNPPAAAAFTVAAVLAGAQAGVAAGAPEPAEYTPQPLPAPPKKLAAGGIFMPQAGGTNITMSSGAPAITAEAGIPELYLPITTENIDAMFRAAGIDRKGAGGGFSYAPVFQLNFQDTDGLTRDDVMGAIRDADRELLSIVEEAKRNYYMGE